MPKCNSQRLWDRPQSTSRSSGRVPRKFDSLCQGRGVKSMWRHAYKFLIIHMKHENLTHWTRLTEIYVSHSVVVHATYGNLHRLWWAARWQQSAALHDLSCTRPRWASAAPAEVHRGPQNDDHICQLAGFSCTPRYWPTYSQVHYVWILSAVGICLRV